MFSRLGVSPTITYSSAHRMDTMAINRKGRPRKPADAPRVLAVTGLVDEPLVDALDRILAREGLTRSAWVRSYVAEFVAANQDASSPAQGELIAS